MNSSAGGRGERGFARYAWVVLGYNLAVILWGAVVRATGSGGGCGEHWPLCQGQVIPHANQTAAVIEFAHRAGSGIDVALVAGLVYLAFRRFGRGDSVRWYAATAAFFTLTGGLIGAKLALYGGMGGKVSMGSVGILSLHLANTFLLLAALTLTAWAALEPGSQQTAQRPAEARAGKFSKLYLAYGAGLVAIVIVAISDAIALFPAGSLVQTLRRNFVTPINPIVSLRIIYPLIAIVTGLYLIVLGAHALYTGVPAVKRLARGLLGLVVVQMWASIFSVLLLSPLWRQVLHMFAADLMWIMLVLLSAERLGWRRVALPVRPQPELPPATVTPGQ